MAFRISSSPIERSVADADRSTGAVVVFDGIVRNNNEGREVASLEYEAMESLAFKEGNRILDEACQKFPIIEAECVHRIGHLMIGDIAIRVVVSAGHRKEAFGACAFIVDEVKSRVPIWKKEHYVDGSTDWIGAGLPHSNTLTP